MWDRLIGFLEPNVRVSGTPLDRRLRRLSPREQREEAKAFISAFYTANSSSRSEYQQRWSEVKRSLNKTGYYEHTPQELAFGARIAWRNHAKCIGRLFWESLEVIDCRHLNEPQAIANSLFSHMDMAFNQGKIRSVISIFEPVKGNLKPCWIESSQLIQYACYQREDHSLIGDRQNSELTRIALSLGWQPPQKLSQFDVLPIVIRDQSDQRYIFDIPPEIVHQIKITHTNYPEIEALGLRWYSVPMVTGMILTIGGIEYPCAPFNGFYMGTEIGSRDLADAKRYDLLPTIARAIGLDPDSAESSLWRDRTLTEINAAVIQSFIKAGVTILDHHSASQQFMKFHRQEQAMGRRVAADWSWIVPPQASAACEVFHLPMHNFNPVPNYYQDRGTDGLKLMPWYGDIRRSRLQRWADRIFRLLKFWRRIAW